jgi:hypothetical protein
VKSTSSGDFTSPGTVATRGAIPDAKTVGIRPHTLMLSARPPESLFPITSRDDLLRKFQRLFADVQDLPNSSEVASPTSLPPRKKPTLKT